jgi:hypothetical protein
VTRLAPSTVRVLLKVAYQAAMSRTTVVTRGRSKLSQWHLDYLLHPDTLNQWAHLSLKQRTKMFHRRFPELTVSASLLHRTYKKHGVRFKYIQKVKKIIDYSNEHYAEMFRRMQQQLREFKEKHMKLVFLDEAVFTFNTFGTKAWAGKYNSIKVNEQNLRVKTQALIAAISEDVGLETYMLHPRSINAEQFIIFLD